MKPKRPAQPKTNITITQVKDRRQREQVYDMLSKVFSGNDDYYRTMHDVRAVHGSPENHYDWTVSLVGFAGDQVVSNFGVWDYQTRVGSARLRTGGVGVVATHGDYRKQGIMSRTIRASIEAMRSAGYDITILFGIPDFYHRFGYSRAWSDTAHIVDLKKIPAETGSPRLRRFSPIRSAEAIRLYNKTHARLVGTAVRPTFRRMYMSRSKAYRWSDSKGKLKGYVIVRDAGDKEPMLCLEAVGDSILCLQAVRSLARRMGRHQVRFVTIPYLHPLLVLLRRHTCTTETNYQRSAHAMARTLNLEQAFGKMRAELERRLRASAYADWTGKLSLSDADERVMLQIGKGRILLAGSGTTKHSIRAGDKAAQLLLGTDDPLEVAAAARMRLTGDARGLITALFPAQYPTLSAWDRY
ncbi:GNAT family N-acetyltransferase [Candidatus Eisenbacteria bacterium]|uniref:GNAT family N-acetyltransferase n=1 Tax=Eiseniibacteriota bacterium TaxID=2212470 RepID=A0ABV6YM31_UNCEI